MSVLKFFHATINSQPFEQPSAHWDVHMTGSQLHAYCGHVSHGVNGPETTVLNAQAGTHTNVQTRRHLTQTRCATCPDGDHGVMLEANSGRYV